MPTEQQQNIDFFLQVESVFVKCVEPTCVDVLQLISVCIVIKLSQCLVLLPPLSNKFCMAIRIVDIFSRVFLFYFPPNIPRIFRVFVLFLQFCGGFLSNGVGK